MTHFSYTHVSYITTPTQDILFFEDMPRIEGLPSGCIAAWATATGKKTKNVNLPSIALRSDELEELLVVIADKMGA